MISVADVLKLDLLTGAVVVAGHDGLNNHVQWVHNAGVPDAPAWLNGGELVLTTYINMPESPEEQQQYIRSMAEKGVAGLMLAVGRYVEHVPEYLCDVANECRFPLVEIPYTARFVDIARAVIGRIAQENMEMVERTLTIQKELTRL